MRDISNVKQEIINYRRIVKPQRPTLRLLDRSLQRFAPQDLELYFDDIVDKSERIWDLLENYKEVAEALEATNESVITHQLNDIIRVLTVLSAVMLPLTLITGIYGMNVGRRCRSPTTGVFSFVFPLAADGASSRSRCSPGSATSGGCDERRPARPRTRHHVVALADGLRRGGRGEGLREGPPACSASCPRSTTTPAPTSCTVASARS